MVFFRADGNSKIGAGHIMRCLSIACAYKSAGEEVIFFTADSHFSSLIKNKDINNGVLGSDCMSMESELVLLEHALIEKKPKVIIVDSYYVTEKYLNTLLEICHSYGGKLVYIDDILAFAYPCDYLINYNIFGPDKRSDYMDIYDKAGYGKTEEDYPKFLLGTDFLPLREEFANLPERKTRLKAENVLISTGGADAEHIALAIVKYISCNYIGNLKFHIIVGAMNNDKAEIEKISLGYENIILHYNVKDMVSLMQSCDVAISAAGSTLYELCATQTPTITYVVADNQMFGAESFKAKGVMECIGDIRNMDTEKFLNSLISCVSNLCVDYKYRKEISTKQSRLVDGYGCRNIIKEIIT